MEINKFKFHFVYIITNLINSKQYVGDHSTNNINDNYLGGGSYIKRSIKNHGKENFKREILEYFDTKQEAFNAQEKYIIQYNTLAPNGYNLSTKGGHQCKNSVSEETRKKMSNAKKGQIPWSKGRTGVFSKETILRMIEAHKNDVAWNKGKTGIYTEETKQKMRDAKKEIIPWSKGVKFTEEHKARIKESHRTPEYREKMSKLKIGIKFTEEHKAKMRKPKSEELKTKIRNSCLNKEKPSDEIKLKISEGLKKMYAKKRLNGGIHKKKPSEETKLKISEGVKNACKKRLNKEIT